MNRAIGLKKASGSLLTASEKVGDVNVPSLVERSLFNFLQADFVSVALFHARSLRNIFFPIRRKKSEGMSIMFCICEAIRSRYATYLLQKVGEKQSVPLAYRVAVICFMKISNVWVKAQFESLSVLPLWEFLQENKEGPTYRPPS